MVLIADRNEGEHLSDKVAKVLAGLIKRIPMSTQLARAIYDACSNKVLQNKNIRHVQSSLIYSKEDATPSSYLIEVCAGAIKVAWETELTCGNFELDDIEFLNVYPGEHYRLLDASVRSTEAKKIVEIGTFTGLGTLALRGGLEREVAVTTYDIIEWDRVSAPSHLKASDFVEGGITQVIGDLARDDVFSDNLQLLNEADLIFMDAPKDDVFEYKMASNFQKLEKKASKLLLIDDIQFVNMIDFWRSIKSPKLDVTSFGHWSGTGVVDISDGFKFSR